jgi:hypothetical protein
MGCSLELVKSSYLGGRNDCAFVGRSSSYEPTKNSILPDVDITSCYSTGMSKIAKLNIAGCAEYIPVRYCCDDTAKDKMLKSNVPPEIIEKVETALQKSQAAFDRLLGSSKKLRRFAERIRKVCIVYDTRLLDRWVALSPDNYVIPGFATVEFEFPDDTLFPCLPMKHRDYGLIYPLKGITTVPASEILLALQAGATVRPITSLELPVKFNKAGRPFYLFRSFMKAKIKERERYKAKKSAPDNIRQEILKNILNGLYGKVAQAINPRKVFRPSKGRNVLLQQSKVTDPCSAALITGLIRSVLSAILLSIEQYNRTVAGDKQLVVISFTTDGLIFSIPTPPGYDVKADYFDIINGTPVLREDKNLKLKAFLNKFGAGELLKIMESYLPVRQMQSARRYLSNTSDFLEIKHLLNEVISIKTRGQLGFLDKDECLLLAKFGHKPPIETSDDPDGHSPDEYERMQIQAQWFLEHLKYMEGPDET